MTIDHNRWLREKRADAYVEMMQFVRVAGLHRDALFRTHEITDEVRRMVRERRDTYSSPELGKLCQ
jgi:hypothetical protein